VFCLSSAIRAFRDEALFIVAAWGSRQDRATRAALQAEVTQLRAEMQGLRTQGVVSSQYVALMTCERLLRDYFERQLDITRRAALTRGYSRAQWDAAQRLLKVAQVVDGQGTVRAECFAAAWSAVLHMQSAGMGSFVVTEHKDLVRQ
jgi:hypothetical protein